MITITLDKRLLKCSEMVRGEGIVCDVGTDHAYLPAYLINEKICGHAIAADIADGPLESARATAEKSGLLDKITLIKSDGLKSIAPDGITDVIIAGMGAETISHIISEAEWLKNDINIIIQPMTKIPFMRKWIYANGYEIIKEEAVSDEGFVYTVMNVRYSGYSIRINDTSSNAGLFDYTDEAAVKYGNKQLLRIKNISEGIKKSDPLDKRIKSLEEVCRRMNDMISGNAEVTVGDVYREINRVADFSTQDSWDNSGLLVGDFDNRVTGILVALDITNAVIEEAIIKKVNLIISHHPIIFHPLKKLSMKAPAVRMAAVGISAICVHTPLDMAKNGINDIIYEMLRKPFSLTDYKKPIISVSGNDETGTGRICKADIELNADEMAVSLKKIFGCHVVRYTKTSEPIKKIAFCSGSGGSLMENVIDYGCHAYITGDVKHDVWIDAANNNIALFDCGHYYTEIIAVEYIVKLLRANIPGIKIESAASGTDIVSYVI